MPARVLINVKAGFEGARRRLGPGLRRRRKDMQTMKQAAAEFLAGKRVAVTGVSRNPQSHGSNVVYQRLRQRGYAVFPVNPNADQVEGDTEDVPAFVELESGGPPPGAC